MENFRYAAARGEVGVICRASGLLEASYSGPLSRRIYGALRDDMMGVGNNPSACVVRLDRALILTSDMPELPVGRLDPTPACMIVRRDQYLIFQDYATRLSRQGAIRLVFLEEYAHLAYGWALARCSERSAQ